MAELLNDVRRFIELAESAQRIIDADVDADTGVDYWKTKHDLIFSSLVKGEVDRTGIKFEWFDSDTSYEEDARQYVEGLTRKARSLQAILDHLDTMLREEVTER